MADTQLNPTTAPPVENDKQGEDSSDSMLAQNSSS